jgi:hypothetical protein
MRSRSLNLIATAVALMAIVHCKGEGPMTPPDSPSIELSATDRSFTATAGGANPAPQTVEVTNRGGGTLSSLSANATYQAGETPGWLSLSLNPITAPATLEMIPITGSLAPGQYHATVAIGSSAADNSPQGVSITFTVMAGSSPAIALSATDHPFTATAGGPNPTPFTVQVTNGGTGSLTGLAVTVGYAAAEPTGWLSATLDHATAPATLTLAATTGSLAPGVYHATADVTSPVAGNSPRRVELSFQVDQSSAGPTIVITPTSRSFTAQEGGANPAQQTVQITNGGGGTLSGLGGTITYAAGQPTGWLGAAFSGPTAPATLIIAVATGSLASGTYTGYVTINSAVASNSPQQVTVTFTVGERDPVIGLSANSVSFTATEGGSNPALQTLQVTNTGGGTLDGLGGITTYAAGEPTGWLLASLGTTNAPTTLTFRATTGSLTAGTYHATVTLTAPGASNTPLAVPVTFTVGSGNPPMISLSAGTRTFTATAGGGNPGAQSLQVGNSGGGTLTGLQAAESPAASWLSVSLSTTTAPATITLQATTGSLTAGTYTTTVNVTSPVAGNNPQGVLVTFIVSPALTAPVLAVPTVVGSDVQLTWTYTWPGGLGSSNDGYMVERSTSQTTGFTQIYSVATHASPFTLTVTGLAAGTHYFRVRALTTQGLSPYSTVQSAVVAGPSEITVYANEDNTLIFSSTDPTLANTTYRFGSLEVGCNFSVLPLGTEYVCGEGLMRFPVQSQIAGRSILSAELRLYPQSIGADQQTNFRLAAVARTWSTTTVTSNSLHNGSEVYSGGQVLRAAPTTTVLPYTFDVTTIVRNWASGTFANNGLLMWDTATFPLNSVLRSVAFNSADSFADPATRPQLVIRFQ